MTTQPSLRAALVATGLLAASVVHAQSNVTIYGRLDLGLRLTTHVNAAGASLKEVASGSTSGSRLGFKGTEDLGGGMKASFTIEQGINPDTGTLAQSGKAWGRQSWVAIENSLGRISAGRQYSPVYVVEAMNEPFGAYNLFEPGFIYDNYTGTPSSGSGGNRWDNSMMVSTKVAAASASAMVSLGEGATGSASVGRKEGMTLGYAAGNLALNGAWQQTRNGSGMKNHKVWTAGGTYDVAPVKVYVSYLDHRSDTSVQTNKVWAVGANYAVSTEIDLVGGVYHDAQSSADGSKTTLALMGNYKLSKRTNVYLQADHGKLSGSYASNVFNQYVWPTGIDSRSSATLGLRHMF